MAEKNKKLDPAVQENWDNQAKKFDADFDSLFEAESDQSPNDQDAVAVVNSAGETTGAKENLDVNRKKIKNPKGRAKKPAKNKPKVIKTGDTSNKKSKKIEDISIDQKISDANALKGSVDGDRERTITEVKNDLSGIQGRILVAESELNIRREESKSVGLHEKVTADREVKKLERELKRLEKEAARLKTELNKKSSEKRALHEIPIKGEDIASKEESALVSLGDKERKEDPQSHKKLVKSISENPEIEKYLRENSELKEYYANANEKDKILMILAEKNDRARKEYVREEYDFKKESNSLFNFFRKKIDLKNKEEELKAYRERYDVSMQEYVDAILEIEGITEVDGKEQEMEIMMRYLKVSENLDLQDEKIRLEAERNPKLTWAKEHLESIGVGYLKGYKTASTYLSKKISKFVAEKTTSKVLRVTGGLSGGLAFGVGLSRILGMTGAPSIAIRSFLMASSVSLATIERKDVLDEEYRKNKDKKIEADIYNKLDDIRGKIDAELNASIRTLLGEEIRGSIKSFEEGEEEKANFERWKEAFTGAIMKSAGFFAAGWGLAEIFGYGHGHGNNVSKPENLAVSEEPSVMEQPSSPEESPAGGEGKDQASPVETGAEAYAGNSIFKNISDNFEKNNLAGTEAYKEFEKAYGNEAYEKYMQEHMDETDPQMNWSRNVTMHYNEFMNRALNEIVGGMKGSDLIESEQPLVAEQPAAPGSILDSSETKKPIISSTETKPESLSGTANIDSDKFMEAANLGEHSIINSVDLSDEAGERVLSSLGISSHELHGQHAPVSSAEEAVNVENTVVAGKEFVGIELGEEGTGTLIIEKGSSLEKTIKEFLIANKDSLTDGNMGWNENKFFNEEDWAGRRAHVIAQEFAEDNQGYNIDAVSPGTEIVLNISNPADIKLEELNDDLNLGAQGAEQTVLGDETKAGTNFDRDADMFASPRNPGLGLGNAETISKNSSSAIEFTDNPEAYKSAELAESLRAEDVTKHEMELAHRLEIDPDHYAEINNISVEDFIKEVKDSGNLEYSGGENTDNPDLPEGDFAGSGHIENRRLGVIMNYLVDNGKIEDPSKSVSEILRSVSESDFQSALSNYESIFGVIPEAAEELSTENWGYGEYVGAVIQGEIKEMIQSGSSEGRFLREITEIRGESMADVADNDLLTSFNDAVKNSVGIVEHGNNETVGRYILKSLRKAYEMGVMGELREEMAKIKINE